MARCKFVQVMEFKVTMHCEGCAGSVRRGLKRIPGNASSEADQSANYLETHALWVRVKVVFQ